MREILSHQESTPYSRSRALLLAALLTACQAGVKNNTVEENDQNPPAGPADTKSDTKAVTKNTSKKNLSMEIYKDDAGVTVFDFIGK